MRPYRSSTYYTEVLSPGCWHENYRSIWNQRTVTDAVEESAINVHANRKCVYSKTEVVPSHRHWMAKGNNKTTTYWKGHSISIQRKLKSDLFRIARNLGYEWGRVLYISEIIYFGFVHTMGSELELINLLFRDIRTSLGVCIYINIICACEIILLIFRRKSEDLRMSIPIIDSYTHAPPNFFWKGRSELKKSFNRWFPLS